VRVLDAALYISRIDFQIDACGSAGEACRGNGARSGEGSPNRHSPMIYEH
jgi:hypothetical protein